MVTPVPVKLSRGPFHGRFFHLISISMENCFKCNSIVGYHITTKFCTCPTSTIVVRCAKFHNDHFSATWMREKWIFHRIWINIENGSLTNMGEIYHFSDVIMSVMASLITGVSIVYSSVCSGADQRKHQSSTSLAFVRGIHRWPVYSQHKGQSNADDVSIWWRHHATNREACAHLMSSLSCSEAQALHRPSHTRHSHHAGSGVGCVMYTLEGTKRSSGPARNFARNGRRTA